MQRLYSVSFPVIPDDVSGFARTGGRSAKEICIMAIAPLMPKATAVWLVENTALSFDQIAQFCNLHPLEVKAIADGDAAQGIKGLGSDPDRPVDARGNRRRAKPIRTTGCTSPIRRSACRRPSRRKARATRRCRAGRIGRTRSCGWCAIIPNSKTARSCGWSARRNRRSRRSASAPTGTRPT